MEHARRSYASSKNTLTPSARSSPSLISPNRPISRHLSVLKEADLVIDQRRGQNVIYRLNDGALAASMRQFFGQFRSCQEVLR